MTRHLLEPSASRPFVRHGALIGLLIAGCGSSSDIVDAARGDDTGSAESFRCNVDQPFPYADTSYAGVHGNRSNNDFVPCDTASVYEEAWSALAGGGAAQPNTFSPDGTVTYATTSAQSRDDCSVHALDVETGAVLWCRAIPGAVVSSVEVDEDGNLYVTGEAEVVSLDPRGEVRWTTPIPQLPGAEELAGGTGLHFERNGHIATVDDDGTIHLVRRSDGTILTDFSIPEEFGLVAPPRLTAGLDLVSGLPAPVVADFEAMLGAENLESFLALFAGGGSFSDNTLGVGLDGHLYIVGGGRTPEGGALVQVRVGGTADAPTLSAGWRVDLVGGSATSPSISPDGRFVSVGDGSSLSAFLSPARAEANVRVVDIAACDRNTDEDPDPAVCVERHTVPFASGPALGSLPLLDEERYFTWEVQVALLLENRFPDVRAFQGETLLWEASLPEDRQWTAVLTVTNNHIVGTATRLTASEERLFTITLPATASSEVIVIDRTDGHLVFAAPVSDDSTSTVTVGPDGSLYINKLGLIHALAVDTPFVGGVTRYRPRVRGR